MEIITNGQSSAVKDDKRVRLEVILADGTSVYIGTAYSKQKAVRQLFQALSAQGAAPSIDLKVRAMLPTEAADDGVPLAFG